MPYDTEEQWAFALPRIEAPRDAPLEGDMSSGVAIHMSPEFAKRMRDGYLEDPAWKHTLDVTKRNIKLGQNAATLPFQLRERVEPDGEVVFEEIDVDKYEWRN